MVGQLVLETLIIEGEDGEAIVPSRGATGKMPNVWFFTLSRYIDKLDEKKLECAIRGWLIKTKKPVLKSSAQLTG